MQRNVSFRFLLLCSQSASKPMKKLALIILVVSILTGSTQSCLKEDTPAVNEPDSGYYDPTSYFPLKWGAKWVYETSTGDIFTVDCGAHYIDSIKIYQYTYAYSYHILSMDPVKYTALTGIAPYYPSKFWGGAYVGGYCPKGSPYANRFMSGGNGIPGQAYVSYYCPNSGPSGNNYYCLDSAIQIDGYSNVYSYCTDSPSELDLVFDSVTTYQRGNLSFFMPILPKPGKTMGKAYYAPGVGIVRKEVINDQGQVLDYMRLVSYHFP